MDFIEIVIRSKRPEDHITIHLTTGPDEGNMMEQRELLDSIVSATSGAGVDFSWSFDGTGSIHGREIKADSGWKMVLDRGLDIFQAPIRSEGFSLSDRMQEHRLVKGFYVTYVKV